VQTLKAAGARVIGTCSTDAKASIAREAGADEVIRYDQHDFAEVARELTEGRGVDVVYDAVGQATFDASLRSLCLRGLLVLYGHASGRVAPFDPLRLNHGGGLTLMRPSLAHYTATRQELELRASAVFSALESGALHVTLGARYPLANAAEAHRALESRATTGKLLLDCRLPVESRP
jgi:NADPH2:quinone reductase